IPRLSCCCEASSQRRFAIASLARAVFRLGEYQTHTRPIILAAPDARVLRLHHPLRKWRAQGMPDATAAPATLRALKKARKQVTTGTPEHRHSLRDGFTAYSALSSECRA